MTSPALGHTQLAMGRHDQAHTTMRQALALARRSGLRGIAAGCLAGLGNIELELGHLPAAQRWYQESCAALVGLGRVSLGQGRPAEARKYFRQALAALTGPIFRVNHRHSLTLHVRQLLADQAILDRE